MARLRVAQTARRDIAQVLAWSEANFGPGARIRYEALISAAMRDAAADPVGPSAAARPELGPDVYTRHLARSRASAQGRPVGKPRHFLVYRVEPDRIVVSRLLHDAMDIARHPLPR
jgi:toxin ParE1/3/4